MANDLSGDRIDPPATPIGPTRTVVIRPGADARGVALMPGESVEFRNESGVGRYCLALPDELERSPFGQMVRLAQQLEAEREELRETVERIAASRARSFDDQDAIRAERDEARRERDEARETNRRLNRRCQEAEAEAAHCRRLFRGAINGCDAATRMVENTNRLYRLVFDQRYDEQRRQDRALKIERDEARAEVERLRAERDAILRWTVENADEVCLPVPHLPGDPYYARISRGGGKAGPHATAEEAVFAAAIARAAWDAAIRADTVSQADSGEQLDG